MASQTPAKQIFDLLVTKNFDPELLNSSGQPATDPSDAEILSFDFTTESGNDYGTVVVMIADDNDMQIYFGDNLGRSMEAEDKQEWYDFLSQVKNLATRNLLSFSLKNLNRLKYSMAGQAALKEGLFESWTGTKTTSWNGKPTEARLMIKHKRAIGENDARFRYVESLFIETAEGERYKLPFTKLSGGRAMVEHIRNGGKPYDTRGQHISEMVNELNVLSRFRRANQGHIFEGDTATLVEQTIAYQESLKKQLKNISTKRGYSEYFESWNPNEITEEEVVIEGLKHLFVTQSLDTRIEQALPLLARIQQQGNAMKEANIFEAWANRLMEGTWAIPDSKEKQAKLVELLSKELIVGPDATNATEQLYDLFGDDELFDQLEALAAEDADADCRQVVYDRLQMLSDDPSVQEVITQLQIDPEAEMNPAPQVDPATIATDAEDEVTDEIADSDKLAESALRSLRKAAGFVVEDVTLDENKQTFQHIVNTFKRDINDFKETNELSDHLYDALFDYYQSDMPYGTAKARTGDPYEWIADRLGADLGLLGFGANSPTDPEEDYSLERESVEGPGVEGGMDNPVLDTTVTGGIDEAAMCNMTEAGCACPVHGMDECGMTTATPPLEEKDTSALAGQYGHSGKMKEVSKDLSFLGRLKELSGMKK